MIRDRFYRPAHTPNNCAQWVSPAGGTTVRGILDCGRGWRARYSLWMFFPPGREISCKPSEVLNMSIQSIRRLLWLGLVLYFSATSLWAQDAMKKAPVPEEAAQAKAMMLLKEVYSGELSAAKTADQKKALAKKLLAKAAETTDDLTSKYVLLKAAKAIATQAVDAGTALESIDSMADSFEVDTLAMKTSVLNSVSATARLVAEHVTLAELALGLMDRALDDDKFDTALELGNLGLEEARKAQPATAAASANATGGCPGKGEGV